MKIGFNLTYVILFIIFAMSSLMSIEAKSFSQETQLSQKISSDIQSVWHQGSFDNFSGKNGIKIEYAAFNLGAERPAIVLSPGRSEGYLKYQELTYDLINQGFNVFIIDHRGQGISQRMLANKYKGYVKKFDDYAEDLNVFIEDIVKRKYQQKQLVLLAHSMGGAIASRYMQLYPETNLKAAVLSSPMISINSGGTPKSVANLIVTVGANVNGILSDTPWYFLGQNDYQSSPFEDNSLSQSKVRYKIFTSLYNSTPDIQLGGVTFHWLNEAKFAETKIFKDIKKIKIPTLVLQSGADSIVDNQAQNKFCQMLHSANNVSCPGGKAITITNAKHELFFEIDDYRNKALIETLNWFNTHLQSN